MVNRRSLLSATILGMVILTPLATLAAPGCGGEAVTVSPQKMSALWAHSIEQFAQKNSDLSATQLDVLVEALDLARPATFAGGAVDREALRDVIARMEKNLSLTHLGQIFSRMGSGQAFLSQVGVLAAPYCNCASLGSACTLHPGTCKTGCISWEENTKENADAVEAPTYWVGICSD